MGLIASVAFSIVMLCTPYIHVLTWGNNTFSHIEDHTQTGNLFLHMPFMCCESGRRFINLFSMQMRKSVEIACSALMVPEETMSVSEFKLEWENQKSLWKRDIYM